MEVQSIEFFIGAGSSQMQRLSLRLAFLTLLGPPEKKLGVQSIEFFIGAGFSQTPGSRFTFASFILLGPKPCKLPLP